MVLTSSRDGSCHLRLSDSYYYETVQAIDTLQNLVTWFTLQENRYR